MTVQPTIHHTQPTFLSSCLGGVFRNWMGHFVLGYHERVHINGNNNHPIVLKNDRDVAIF